MLSGIEIASSIALGLGSSLLGIALGKLLINLQLKRRIRIAREIEAAVIAETGSNDPNTDKNKESQDA